MFTVAGDTPVDRWPVAVMTDYDGVIWTVADPERDPEATEFVPVDTAAARARRPAAGRLDDGRAHGDDHTTSAATSCPTAGVARRLDLARRSSIRRLNLRHRHDRPARRRRRRADVRGHARRSRPRSPRTQLAAATITPVDRSEELELLPPPVRNLAADLVEGRDARLGPDGGDPRRVRQRRLLRRHARHPARALLRPHRHDARGPRPRSSGSRSSTPPRPP